MLENFFSSQEVQPFKDWLDWADRYVIVAHTGPDGDAVGSTLALCHFLQGKGKSAFVALPNCPPDFLMWLPGADSILTFDTEKERIEKLIYDADVVCCLDFNHIGRIGDMATSVLYTKAHKVMIDHHLNPGPFCNLVLSRSQASSTCELIFHFLCALGEFNSLTTDMSECIYAGMMTDTGSFTYNSNRASVYFIISQLIDKGIDKDGIYRKIINNYSEDRMRLIGYALKDKMRIIDKSHISIMTLDSDELERYHYKDGDTEGLVNMPLQISEMKMSVFIRQVKKGGEVKLSFRSVGSVPCNRFASDYFNGGGHLNASGCEFDGTVEEAVQRVSKGIEDWRTLGEECIMQLFTDND